MDIGVLALQGAFREHQASLAACGVKARQIRKPEHLEGLDGLIIPGGESTTMGKLLMEFKLFDPLLKLTSQGLPVFGTCAGLILLAREIVGSEQPRLGLMDMTVERNAFGRQVDSFEAQVDIDVLGKPPVPAVFIRAPYIVKAGPGLEILARYEGKIVCAQQGCFLTAAFHPELTPDIRLHKYFLENIIK
ncbi:MAG: pyridoxal 5'-phosphate synthase glutaminase subunit PdxT [Bacillota bacterium]|jgi:5'-phosphate synthase pdxT subunit